MRTIFYWLMAVGLLTGCNSKVSEGLEVPQEVTTKACSGAECAVCVLPWGGTLASGQTIDSAFSKNIVTCDKECSDVAVTMTCEDGVLKSKDTLSGLLLEDTATIYPKCYKQRCDCEHNGTVVEDGKIKSFFKSVNASCTTKCESRELRCRSGKIEDVLEPSKLSWTQMYKNVSCDQIPCASCTTPWGATVSHGGTTDAYSQDSVNCGATCTRRTLTCNNGALSGADLNTFRFGQCNVKACQNCDLPSGDSILHGKSTPVFSASESSCTQNCSSLQKSASCNNGVITGVDASIYRFASCTPKTCATCKLPCNVTISSGASRSCYKESKPSFCGETCVNEALLFKCDNGVIKKQDGIVISDEEANLYKSSGCNDLAACSSCKLSDGRAITDGMKYTFYKSKSVPCGQQCLGSNSQTLVCSNGTFANSALYPDFKELSCEQNCDTGTAGDYGIGNVEGDGGGAPRQMCQLPWRGGVVTHKTQLVAFSRMSVPRGEKCSSYKKLIECNGVRGLWTGGAAYIYPTCLEEK